MYYYYEVALFGKPEFLLTYKADKDLQRGLKVKVPLGKRKALGLIWKKLLKPSFQGKIASIDDIVDQRPVLLEKDMKFYEFCADYYHCPPPLLLKAAFCQKAQEENHYEEFFTEKNNQNKSNTEIQINDEQSSFINAVCLEKFQTYLLDGITGSGKTICYIHLAKKVLERKNNILILVPEISLIENMKAQVHKSGLGSVTCYHSQINPAEKAAIFSKSRQCQGHIFITTRSGIFLPIASLGLIVVDEEHDSSFKEENKAEQFFGHRHTFCYNARDLAIKKAQLHSCPCILGTATPSIETLGNVENHLFKHFQLTKRATGYKLPEIEMIGTSGSSWKHPAPPQLLLEIKTVLDQNKQVLIYLNQRGYIPSLYCKNCHLFLTCPRCSSKLVCHKEKKEALCHSCCHKVIFKEHCQRCDQPWTFYGFGTERLKEYLEEVFPMSPITVFDTDHLNTHKKLTDHLQFIKEQKTGIIIGTQMVCKGHNWPHVALSIMMIGHYQLEQSLLPSVAQNLLQVAGRSGRFDKGRAILPYPLDREKPEALKLLSQHQYLTWLTQYRNQCQNKKIKFAKINIRTKYLEKTMKALKLLADEFTMQVLEGPFLDFPSHFNQEWKLYFVLKGTNYKERKKLIETLLPQLQKQKGLTLSLDIDPLETDLL
jgi:primosomal protein N' (replication factor Y)